MLTLATAHLQAVTARDPALAGSLGRAMVLRPDPETLLAVRGQFETLARELGWSAPGHRAAVEAALLSILVALLRATPPGGAAPAPPGVQAALVARFRARIEARFRLREPVAAHAHALGVSETRLRAACARIAALSPAAMLDERAMLEARRSLLYSNLSVAEVGYALGFADPAYFSRFFARHAGRPPRRFRAERGQEAAPPASRSRSGEDGVHAVRQPFG